MTAAAFYTVADSRYHLGAVALVNSLRLQGHAEPIFVLDCGLEPPQRRALATEATIVDGPRGAPPWLLKTIAPLRHPVDVPVLIDADMVATRSLADLVERAAAGRVVAFENDLDRFVADWGELLDLGPIRRRRYVSSGLVLCGGEAGAETIRLLDDRQRRVDISRGFFGTDAAGYPFRFPEQDVLNAILSTRIPDERVDRLPVALAAVPPFDRLRVVDPRTLRCAHADGTEPYVLHQFGEKPWLKPMYHGPYSRLLRRLWLGDDVPVRLAEDQLPRRFRRGFLPRLERRAAGAYDLARWYGRRLSRRG